MPQRLIVVTLIALTLVACAAQLPPVPENYREVDARIVREANAAIAELSLNGVDEVSITSEKGIVTVDGTVMFQTERYSVLDEVEKINGVRAVHDSLHVPVKGTSIRSQ